MLKFDKDNLIYNILQFVIFLVLIGLILTRLLNYKIQTNSWVWIINYIGMSIAFVNLFINKCFELKVKHSNKYKPFVGFTICMIVVVLIFFLVVQYFQTTIYSQSINDIITLFALFFSLSHTIWNSILNLIVKDLKR
jgi:membrane protease YdiL (CAAX protease family)